MSKKNGLKILGNLDVIVASLALVVLVVLTASGVIMRYVVGEPYTWLEEAQLFCMVWIVFCSAGAAFRTGNHVAIEMVVESMPDSIQKIIGYVIDLVVLAVLCFLFFTGTTFIGMLFESGRSSSMLKIPYWFDYGIVLVSSVLMIINYFYAKYFMKKEEGNDE